MRLHRAAKATLPARFARLTRSQGPSIVRDQASATRLLEKAAAHSGVDLWKYVDEVRYGNFEYPSFSVQGRVRVIQIPTQISQSNKYEQLLTAAHEINHARIYDKFLKRLGYIRGHEEYWSVARNRGTQLYAREEVIVERTAQIQIRSVFEGKLSGSNLRRFIQAIDNSNEYIRDYRMRM